MSAESEVTPDDPQMTQDLLPDFPEAEEAPTTQEAEEPSMEEEALPEDEYFYEDEDQPLNAEEATILVLHFLQRLRKRIITPRKAVLNGDNVFVINVELWEANATVHINAETREITEYTIEPIVKELKPLPIPPRRIALALVGATALLIVFIFNRPILDFLSPILSAITTDHLIIGGALLIVAGIVVWWRRR